MSTLLCWVFGCMPTLEVVSGKVLGTGRCLSCKRGYYINFANLCWELVDPEIPNLRTTTGIKTTGAR